ncbi:MAG: rod shape-determining protein MreC [Clostridia bacterium]|nr:rod shape-determining protein MreC [Clostridia bacterium]
MSWLRKHRNHMIGLALLIILLVTVRLTGFERAQLSRGEMLMRDMIAPLQSGVTFVSKKANDIYSSFFLFRKVQRENEELNKLVDELKTENNLLREYRQENIRLKELLGFQQSTIGQYSLTAAQVIGKNPSGLYRTLTINKGKNNGIAKNMPVINDKGVVGRIINVTPHNSEVLLLLDKEGAVGTLIQETRVPGVTEGTGSISNELQMIHIAREASVSKNHTVVTSGFGGYFPKGLRVGRVIEVVPDANDLMKKALVEPFVDFDRLEEVMVITGVGNI